MLKEIEARGCSAPSSVAASTDSDPLEAVNALNSRKAAMEREHPSIPQELGIVNGRDGLVAEERAKEMVKRSLVEAADRLELGAGVAAVVASAEARINNLEEEPSQAESTVEKSKLSMGQDEIGCALTEGSVKAPGMSTKAAAGAASTAKGNVPGSDSWTGSGSGGSGERRAFAFGVGVVSDPAGPKEESAPPRFIFRAPDAASGSVPFATGAAAKEPAVWPKVAMSTVSSIGGGGDRDKGLVPPAREPRGLGFGVPPAREPSGLSFGVPPASERSRLTFGTPPAHEPSGFSFGSSFGVGALSTAAGDGVDGVFRLQMSRVGPVSSPEVTAAKASAAQNVSTLGPVRPLQQRASRLGGDTAMFGARDDVGAVNSTIAPPVYPKGSPIAPLVLPVSQQESARSANQQRVKCIFRGRRVADKADIDAMKARLCAKQNQSKRLAERDKEAMDRESLRNLHPLSTLRRHDEGCEKKHGHDDECADADADREKKEDFKEKEADEKEEDDQRNQSDGETQEKGKEDSNGGCGAQGGARPPFAGMRW